MRLRSLNGIQFEQMLRGGLYAILGREEEINELNVFPVPDGDTGLNMRATLQHGLKDVSGIQEFNLLMEKVSDGMLLGARGNSGVILSQIFRGFYLEIRRCSRVNVGEFRDMLIRGYKTAYSAVDNPVEGTILTVAREGIENIRPQITRDTGIDGLLGMYIAEMKKSLLRTPELLAVLKEAGVVDSGGMGYITIFEGMLQALQGGKKAIGASDPLPELHDLPELSAPDTGSFDENTVFTEGYCVSFLLQLMKAPGYTVRFNENVFVKDLRSYGNSIVVAQIGSRVKVHIHSMKPGRVLNLAQEYGEFLSLKIDNMQIQRAERDKKIAAKSKKLKEAAHKPLASVAVANGQGFREVFTGLGCDVVLEGGATMNTSADDFLQAFRSVNADLITVFPNHPNIFMAAEQAKALCPERRVEILPSRGMAACYSALQMDIRDSSDVEARLESMRRGLQSLVEFKITRATRDYESGSVSVKKDDYIAFSAGGAAASGETLYDAVEAALRTVEDIEERESVLIFTGEGFDPETEEELTERIGEISPMLEPVFLPGGQPVYPVILGVL
ncbi:MAG: DAK2 domain-containing protein [Lachnospiraceae bacterium]|nr:DAK2 domain-containing protein [Lachnospiraceae bacterium]